MTDNEIKKQLDNKAKMEQEDQDKLHQAMMTRCIPVAKQVLKIIVDRDLDIGDKMISRDENGQAVPMSQDTRPQSYRDAALEIQQVMFDAELLWAERQLVFMLVKQPVSMLENIVMDDMETSYGRGICQLLGIEVLGERSLAQIDEFVKKAKSLGEIMRKMSVEDLTKLASNENTAGSV